MCGWLVIMEGTGDLALPTKIKWPLHPGASACPFPPQEEGRGSKAAVGGGGCACCDFCWSWNEEACRVLFKGLNELKSDHLADNRQSETCLAGLCPLIFDLVWSLKFQNPPAHCALTPLTGWLGKRGILRVLYAQRFLIGTGPQNRRALELFSLFGNFGYNSRWSLRLGNKKREL